MSRIVIGALPWDTMVVVVVVVMMVVKRRQKSYRNFPFMIIERDKNKLGLSCAKLRLT